MSDIRFRHIKPEGRKPRLGLFEKIEKAPCPAADVEKSQSALVPSGKNFMELRQGLPACRIGSSIEEHLNLGVVPLRRFIRHPAARLEVEILEIITWSLPERVFVQDLTVTTAPSAPIDFRKILKKETRAFQQEAR